jgi:DNA replication and repair protein RecF
VETEVVLHRREGRRARLNGTPLRSAEQLRGELATLVFTPDRLGVVKGAPAVRRAYLDRTLGRLLPARAQLPLEYSTAVGQRNAALRRVSAGLSSRDALAPWTATVADLGEQLVAARTGTVDRVGPRFTAEAEALGLEGAELGYAERAPDIADLEARIGRDLELGRTGSGAHLHDLQISAQGRDLRAFGSQGEQRVAVLALVLAEAALLAEEDGTPPLVLLDDVLSELDGDRRRALAARLHGHGQTVVTATAPGALPAEPSQALVVTPGVESTVV